MLIILVQILLNFVYNVYIHIYFFIKNENSSLSNCNNEYVTQYANISCTVLCTCTLRCSFFRVRNSTPFIHKFELTKGNVVTSDLQMDHSKYLSHRAEHHTLTLTHLMSQWPRTLSEFLGTNVQSYKKHMDLHEYL